MLLYTPKQTGVVFYSQVGAPSLSYCLNVSMALLNVDHESAPLTFDLTIPSFALISRRVHAACLSPLLGSDPPYLEFSQYLDCFVPRLSPVRRHLLSRHLRALKIALENADAEFYLDMGSALGAYRHFGFIPYDEDIDIRLNAKDKERAANQLRKLGDHPASQLLFHDTEWRLGHWKVYANDVPSTEDENKPFAFDIFFYERGTGEENILAIPEPPYSFKMSDIFPVKLRPFEGLLMPTPKRIDRMIEGYFPGSKIEQCLFYTHSNISHGELERCQFKKIPCAALSVRYPFVRRATESNFGEVEFLIKGNEILQVAFLPRIDEGRTTQRSITIFQGSSEDWSCDDTQTGMIRIQLCNCQILPRQSHHNDDI